ncbi:hypothetical protein LCGC14_0283700 [marine sediment metagenome]|uniref:Uncharacterized protein n=1 Tax=marine sediment metagenome TaxID=412755 RepID=A0A0F9WGI8_9ZZZZ
MTDTSAVKFTNPSSTAGGSVEDAVAVDVLTGIETGDFARRPARGDDGNFGAKVHEPFEHGRRAIHFGPCGVKIGIVFQTRLALAVIAKSTCFQDRRRADGRHRGVQIGGIGDIGKGGNSQAQTFEELFFDQTVLTGPQGLAVGTDGGDVFDHIQRVGRDVLELERDNINRLGKGGQRVDVIIARGGQRVGDITCRRGGTGFKDMRAKSQTCGGNSQHTAQLPAAQNPNGGPCLQCFSHSKAPPGWTR